MMFRRTHNGQILSPNTAVTVKMPIKNNNIAAGWYLRAMRNSPDRVSTPPINNIRFSRLFITETLT